MPKSLRAALALSFLATAACQTTGATGPTATAAAPEAPAAAPVPVVESDTILARDEVTAKASVKHILISWGELGPTLNGQQDPRAGDRTREAAGKLIKELQARAEEGEDFELLMAEYSEDAGSARSGMSYPVTRDSQLAFMFRRLSLRLEQGELGIVKTQFGYHLIRRME